MLCRKDYGTPEYYKCNDIIQVIGGDQMKVIGISILDKASRPVYYKGSLKQSKYEVEFLLNDIPLKSVKQIHTYSAANENNYWTVWNSSDPNTNNLVSYFCYNNVVFNSKGENRLTVRVIDKHVLGPPRVVLGQEFKVNVAAKTAKNVKYEIDTGGIFTFGESYLPPFQFTFQDETGEAFPILDKVRVKLSLPFEPNVSVRYFNGFNVEEGDPEYQVRIIISLFDISCLIKSIYSIYFLVDGRYR